MSHRICLILTLIVMVGACRSDPPGLVTYVDSAGVRHTISPDTTRTFAEVNPVPVLSLGGADISGPTQFFNVQGIHVDRDGNLWVADGGSGEVRMFRPDGSHWKTVGGRGEGPGEFRGRIRLLGAFRGDSVAIWDVQNPRMTILDPMGELARTESAQWGETIPPQAFGVFPDGTILAKKPVLIPAGTLDPGQLFGDTVWLEKVDLANRIEEPQTLIPGPLWVFTGTNQIPIPFTIHAPMVLRNDEIHLSFGSDFRLRVFRGGHLTEVYGVDRGPRGVTQDALDSYAGLYERYYSDPNQLSEYLSTMDHPNLPRHLPGYHRLVVADDGNVWAQIYTPDLPGLIWDVYAPSREWVGQVEVPVGFSLTTVRDHQVYGIWRDELVIEHVRVYGLRPSGR